MCGKGKKVVEVGVWVNQSDGDSVPAFKHSLTGKAHAFVDHGTLENVKRLHGLSDEQMKALVETGCIDVDYDGEIGGITLEAGRGVPRNL